mmetsp:Transcript_6300/g.23222  ORF Transcript_6300/g.23222 Transcript_6300/m.23222 type:complete len:406 (-) Transcript_6300:2362-3579(-)
MAASATAGPSLHRHMGGCQRVEDDVAEDDFHDACESFEPADVPLCETRGAAPGEADGPIPMSRPSSNGVDGGPHGVCFARFPAEAELLSEAERIVEQLGTYSTGQQVLLYLEAHGLNPRTERWCRRTLLAHHIQPFLNAEGQDHLKAGRRLVTTHRWRKDNQVEELVCEACCKVHPKSHYWHPIGHDSLRRPIMYSCLGMALDRTNVQQNVQHTIQTMEWTISLMPPDVYQFVWICDLYDFGLNDCRPSIGKACVSLFMEHYPERMGKILVVGAPSVFKGLWEVLRLLLDARTKTKVTFVNGPTNASRRRRLLEVLRKEASFDERMAEWAVTEMEQNRDREVSATKSWLGLSLRNEQRNGIPQGQPERWDLHSSLRMEKRDQISVRRRHAAANKEGRESIRYHRP